MLIYRAAFAMGRRRHRRRRDAYVFNGVWPMVKQRRRRRRHIVNAAVAWGLFHKTVVIETVANCELRNECIGRFPSNWAKFGLLPGQRPMRSFRNSQFATVAITTAL